MCHLGVRSRLKSIAFSCSQGLWSLWSRCWEPRCATQGLPCSPQARFDHLGYLGVPVSAGGGAIHILRLGSGNLPVIAEMLRIRQAMRWQRFAADNIILNILYYRLIFDHMLIVFVCFSWSSPVFFGSWKPQDWAAVLGLGAQWPPEAGLGQQLHPEATGTLLIWCSKLVADRRRRPLLWATPRYIWWWVRLVNPTTQILQILVGLYMFVHVYTCLYMFIQCLYMFIPPMVKIWMVDPAACQVEMLLQALRESSEAAAVEELKETCGARFPMKPMLTSSATCRIARKSSFCRFCLSHQPAIASEIMKFQWPDQIFQSAAILISIFCLRSERLWYMLELKTVQTGNIEEALWSVYHGLSRVIVKVLRFMHSVYDTCMSHVCIDAENSMINNPIHQPLGD